jgi:hypothetical protein
MTVIQTILTASLTGAIVSGIVALVGQYFDRKARRRELLVNKAIELAKMRIEFLMRAADKSGHGVHLEDAIIMAESYYQWLAHLETHGRLPNDPKLQR